MREYLLIEQREIDRRAVARYCAELGWDPERLTRALYPHGLAVKETYLETPKHHPTNPTRIQYKSPNVQPHIKETLESHYHTV